MAFSLNAVASVRMNQRKTKTAVSAVLTVKPSRLVIFSNQTLDIYLGLFFIKLPKIIDIDFVFDIMLLINNTEGYIMKKVNIEVLVPENMNWMAINGDGRVNLFEEKPYIIDMEIYPYWLTDGATMHIADVPKPKNYKETLVRI